MSGHSKWATIKHKKAATDKKRGKIFTRLAKDITIAAREGGGDPNFNNALALAIEKAKADNMPKDNIERAIKRGTGELEGGQLETVMYEAYGPHGVGILIETVTDNRNRAVADIRHALGKNGGNMAEAGSVSWQFTRKGYIAVEGKFDQDELFMAAAEMGAEDVQFEDGTAEIYVELEQFQSVRNHLQKSGYNLSEASMIYDPNNPLELSLSESMQVMKCVEVLEDLDDVQNVYSALDMSDETMAALAAA
ncbi:MAG TPA: YebC/PmpR family DNA-binding transcriptional regulator [Chloroflexota bacterium]|nr:YebC/PmpR family DNA-binding transcriptional regulator [Chloroflexota bacterium]HUM69162.1 YebC/PmpR family DNA-binding transcriptional regulator [Chloroflexota bacterium]